MRVLVRESIAEAGVDLLRSKFEVDEDRETPIGEIIGRYDAIVIRSATKLTADLIELATSLKVIGRAGVGVDNVDVEAATRHGIVVANAPESTVVSAAEQTVGLLVALARNIPQAHAALKQHRWERSKWSGVELEGKTLGVLGFGRIGQQVARRAVGLGMRVVAYDPFVADERFRELGVEHAETEDDVLAAVDFLTLHSPLTDETRGMINAVSIAKMKDGARIVNAARGALIDETALAEALESGKLAGAALDVFSVEPYDGPLLDLDGVVVTPHLAASTDEAQDRAGVIIAEQVVAALEGGLVTNAVNIPVVDKASLDILGPFIPLAAKLGRLAVELAGGRLRRVVVAAHGPISDYDTRLLTVAALDGIFRGRVDQTVNYVNASLLAAERGIAVSEERLRASRDYMNVLEVRVTAEGGEEVEVSGTTIGPEPRLFLASALGFGIDIELEPDMVFLRYDDIPGVIGKVGTLFGQKGFNIANMAVSRTRDGTQALMALSVDEPPSEELIEEMHSVGFGDAVFIELLELSYNSLMSWPDPVERVAVFLRASGAESRLEEFPSDASSAQGAADAIGCDLDQIVKSLVFVCDTRSVLALVPGDRRADPAKVGEAVGASETRVARPAEVVAAAGVAPGGVGPFPPPAGVPILIERTLLSRTVVWVGAGSERHMAMVAPVELVRLTGGSTVDIVQE